LLRKFNTLMFFLMIGIAVALGYLLQQQLIESALQQEATRAADQVQHVIAPNLDAADFNGLSPAKIALLDEKVRNLIATELTLQVNIWNKQGILIYSDEKTLIGKQFPITRELQRALNGEFVVGILMPSQEGNTRSQTPQPIGIFMPIRPRAGGAILGAYEIYHDLQAVMPQISETQRLVFGVLALGFVAMYASLYLLVSGASRELVRRNEENELLYQQERRQTQQMQVINQVGRKISAILNPDDLLDQILQALTEQLHYDRANISLMREGRFTTIKLRGYPEPITQTPALLPHLQGGEKRGLVALAAETGKSIAVSDGSIDSRWVPYGPDDPTRSVIAIPMLAHQTLVGVISVSSDHVNAFGPSDITVLELLAAQAATAVENVEMYDASRRHVRRLNALRSIDHSISATLELTRTLDLLIQHALEQTGDSDNAGLVTLIQPESNRLRVAAAKNLAPEFIQHFDLRVGENIVGHVAQDGRPRAITDLTEDQRVKDLSWYLKENLVSLLAVPMRAEGKTIGVLALYTRHRHKFNDEELDFFVTLGGQAAIAVQNAQLYERTKSQALALSKLAQELQESYTATLAAMSAALDARDRETKGHSQRVAQLTCYVARALGITNKAALLTIARGAMLHDVGKIGMHDAILNKPAALTSDECLEMRKHPRVGAEMLRGIKFLEDATPIVLHHHEHWNGNGYPLGLKAEAIPLPARIFAVVDVYDALTSERPYRRAMSHEQAIAILRSQNGIVFDPKVVTQSIEIVTSPNPPEPLPLSDL
jgi:putative nucleotidyltransferase with HDIG domain